MTPDQDPIALAPTKSSATGRAWCFDVPELLSRHASNTEQDATIGIWMVEAPWAHPLWHSYVLFLVHLRPADGVEPAIISLPGATHQFFLYALDPSQPRQGMIDDAIFRWLLPMNFSAQLMAADDAAAIARMDQTVDEILAGSLSPDTDFINAWIARFGDNQLKPEYRRQ
jgi:hypothetical protein